MVAPQQQGEALGVFLELMPVDPALVLVASAMAQGEEPAEPAPSRGRFDEEQEAGVGVLGVSSRVEIHLGPEDCSQARAPGGQVKARGAVDPAPIRQGQGRVAEGRAPLDEVLGVGSALEKREGAARAQFDVIGSLGRHGPIFAFCSPFVRGDFNQGQPPPAPGLRGPTLRARPSVMLAPPWA